MSAAIEFQQVSKSFRDETVVDQLSFNVERGECYGLLGPNGAGKTTSIRMLLGLVGADSGTITLAGESVPGNARRARAKVGVVPQFDNLDPDFTVSENLVVFARYFGIAARAARERVPELLAFARLENRADARVSQLSGGMRRRLTVARALVNRPEVLILDEPTTGLDPQARHLIWERLRALQDSGMTLLLTTHFMDEAERLCNRLCIVDGGRKIAEGSPDALIEAQIGAEVVEIYGQADTAALADALRPLALRVDISGETVFCYVADPAPVVARLRQESGVRYVQRRANLEDVFLRLTGREMRE
ncbi:nodulation factor ABC transporter ATP-binding protein NodI [Chitinasiproducens palmae]|uniref:Nodulation factor export ABC transporter ATP-binding protein NodI n=1 Tax=Chitinasiproducens palmae TaxID=1770053 RepID=A0A1H2PSI7_9BURK|nr:nodulation factor ABC transporter ATP-binding protein NodI [Chitinasiproducens palmae]SDV49909.1 nodulation factor export ABC transporter ATP-binding protein NodI [Chitinasiproducens palmae]